MASKANSDFFDEMDSSEGGFSGRRMLRQKEALEKSESKEFVVLGRSHRPNFKESSMSNQREPPLASRIYYEEVCKRRRRPSDCAVIEDTISVSPRGSAKSRTSRLSRHSKVCQSKSEDSVQNLVLKKADETISSNDFGPDLVDDSQCEAERLRLGEDRKSSGEVTTRSDLFFSDNLINEINASDEHGDGSENISQSYVPFQTYERTVRGSNELVTKTKGEKKSRKLWSKNFFSLNKSQIVAYLGQPRRVKKKKREKIDEKQFYRVEFLGSPVPWQEDYDIKLHLRHFYFHLLELTIITGIAVTVVGFSSFYLTDITASMFMDTTHVPTESNTLEEQHPSLRDSRTVEDFWAFAETTLIDLLYWDFYYSKLDPSIRTDADKRKMFNENQILGVARIRQVRVRENSCVIHPEVEKFFNVCYGYYSVINEDTRPIKRNMDGSATATAWKYSTAKTLNSTFYWGDISLYGGGGYFLDLAPTKDDARNMIKELKSNYWVSRATRAIFIDFNIYNANVNLFCICKIIVEMPPVGGILPRGSFDSLRLIRYLTVVDFVVLSGEFLFFMLVAYDAFQLVRAIMNEKGNFLFFIWNYLDAFLLLISLLYFILSIIRVVYVKGVLDEVQYRVNEFTNFTTVKYIQISFNCVTAIVLFCNWSLQEFLIFSPMFFTILSAFALMAFILFGSQIKNFSSIFGSHMTLMQAFLGDFSYYEIAQANRLLGPIFYVLFVFYIFFVILNMLVAIVNYSYMNVKSQVLPGTPITGKYIKRGFVNLFTCCRPRRRKTPLSWAMRRKLLFADIQKSLFSAGFRKDEIQIFFDKYNINCGNFLESETKTRIMKDLELKRFHYDETTEQFEINILRRRLEEFREKMASWETKLQPVIDKVDVLLNRSS